MQFTSSSLLVIAILATAGLATPVEQAIRPRATDCTQAQTDLAAGIAKNIDVQKNEQSSVNAIAAALKQSNLSDATWEPLKTKLLGFVNQGITIRENNQKIAPSGSKAIAGLSKVATAQAAELKLATGLTGKPATDNANVATLQTDFAGGIKQNQQNQKDALDGCIQK